MIFLLPYWRQKLVWHKHVNKHYLLSRLKFKQIITTTDMYKIRTPLSADRRANNNEIFVWKLVTVKHSFIYIYSFKQLDISRRKVNNYKRGDISFTRFKSEAYTTIPRLRHIMILCLGMQLKDKFWEAIFVASRCNKKHAPAARWIYTPVHYTKALDT